MSGSPTTDSSAAIRRLWLADLALLSVAFIWGVNIPVMKVALEQGITPYALNAIRLVISAVVLVCCAGWEYRGGTRPAAGISRVRIFIYAIVVSVAYQYLFLMAVSKTTSANVALIMATVPMWTALGARFFLREILPPLAWIGLFIAFAGTMIVTVQRESTQRPPSTISASDNSHALNSQAHSPELTAAAALVESESRSPSETAKLEDSPTSVNSDAASSKAAATRLTGNLIALVAALTWAGGTVFSRPLLRTISPVQLAACSATIGLPFHLLIAGPTLAVSMPLLSGLSLQLCVLYSGILSTGFALAMWSFGVKHAGAAQATMFQNLSPIVAIGAAWVWRGENISFPQTVGGLMIIGGLIVMRKSRKVL
jgi:drug/metabolite transporter (DMT)-like permease